MYAEEAEVGFGEHDFEEAAAGPDERVPLVAGQRRAAQGGERVSAQGGPMGQFRLGRQALDHLGADGLLQENQVGPAPPYDLREQRLAPGAPVAYVVAQKFKAHDSPTRPISVR